MRISDWSSDVCSSDLDIGVSGKRVIAGKDPVAAVILGERRDAGPGVTDRAGKRIVAGVGTTKRDGPRLVVTRQSDGAGIGEDDRTRARGFNETGAGG